MWFTASVSRSTLAKANETRNWSFYADLTQRIINIARPLYDARDIELNLQETVYALDSSTIDLCLSLFPWARLRTTKAGIKMHILLDLQGNISSLMEITEAKLHDVNVLDWLVPDPGSIYVTDRAYLEFERLYTFNRMGSFFVVRTKSNINCRHLYSHRNDRDRGLIYDQTEVLGGPLSATRYPSQLRRIKYLDQTRNKPLVFVTNNACLLELKIAQLYKIRWWVKLFFRWVEQHLKIKSF